MVRCNSCGRVGIPHTLFYRLSYAPNQITTPTDGAAVAVEIAQTVVANTDEMLQNYTTV